MSLFGQILPTPPSLTWVGTRSAATKELATKVDARYLHALRQVNPREFWRPFVDEVTVDRDTEIVKYPLDFEDLGAWEEADGQRVARAVKYLLFQQLALKPYKKDRVIPSKEIRRNAFGDWPDKLTSMMLAHRRTAGAMFRDMLFSTGAAGTSSKFYTYQGNNGFTMGTQPWLYPSGHYCDPTDTQASPIFGNLHTGSNAIASGNTLAYVGATSFNTAGWEAIEAQYMGLPGPGGVPLDMRVTFVLGGSAMKPYFKRMFNRVLVLEDSLSGPAAAATTNIHAADMLDAAYGEEKVIPVVTGWLDTHPYLVANSNAQQFWTMSTTYPARAAAFVQTTPTIKVFDLESEYERLEDQVLIKGDADMNMCAAFPHVFHEWRST